MAVTTEVPAWVSWIAQDADGTWWGFEVEPNLGDIAWYENEVGRYVRIQQGDPNKDWQQTLQRYIKSVMDTD